MTRWKWIGLALAMAACGGRLPLASLLPEAVGTAWHRTSFREAPPDEAPDPIPLGSVKRLAIAGYEGAAGKAEARIYELTSAAVALDMVQRWRPSTDSVFFHQRQYLVVVKWQQADRQALKELVQALEQRLPK